MQCNQITRGKSLLCERNNHTVVKGKATLRWFTCQNCGQRVTTLGRPLPKDGCACGAGAAVFIPASMFVVSKMPKRAFLCVRIEFFDPKDVSCCECEILLMNRLTF